MGILDSDSECDSSISSTGEWDVPDEAIPPKSRGGAKAKKDDVISNVNVLEGDIEDRLKALMTLKDAIGVEEDPEYVKKENRKQELKEQLAEQKRKEEEAVKNMTIEEKLQHEKNSVGDMMERIKAKREASKRDLLAASSDHSRKTPARSKSSDGLPAVRRRTPARSKSGDSLGAMSNHSIASGMSEEEMSEFEKLKARKARKTLKQKRSLSQKKIAVPAS